LPECEVAVPKEGSQARTTQKIATYGISGRRAEILVRRILNFKIPRMSRKWEKIVQRFLELKDKGYSQLTLF
jgi:hypothetical protein